MADVTIIRAYGPRFAEAILGNLRPSDRRELAGTGANHCGEAIALRQEYGPAFGLTLDGRPVFVGGIVHGGRNVGQVWGHGTPGTTKALVIADEWLTTKFIPAAFSDYGMTRLEARVPAANAGSLAWLARFGMRVECELPGYAVNGDPHVQIAATKEDFECAMLSLRSVEPLPARCSGESSPPPQ